MEIPKLTEELLILPEQIKVTETKLMAHALKKADLKLQMDLWENRELLKICDEKVDDKAKFSNEMSRKAELSNRKGNNEDYRKLGSEYSDRDVQEQTDAIELNYLKYKFRAVENIINLICWRMK